MNPFHASVVALAVASLTPGAVVAAAMPAHVNYVGVSKVPPSPIEDNYELDLDFKGDQITGTSKVLYNIFGGGRKAVTGTYRDGICTLFVGKRSFRGRCTAERFSGEEIDGRMPNGAFTFLSDAGLAAINAREAAAPPAAVAQRRDDYRSQVPPVFRRELPPEGFFDYVPGDDIAPGSPGSVASGQYGPPGLEAPAGTVWAYGRDRWVIPPGGGCGRAELLRGYCFSDVISYLQSRPKQKDVTVITLSRPVPLGTYISNDTPVRYQFVQVKRDGEWFRADRDLRGTSKVPIPPGCHFSPLREGFILTNPGPRGLQEVALFRCP